MANVLQRDLPRLVSSPAQFPPFDIIFGTTSAMLEVKRLIELVAASDVPVLLQGESGNGKDLAAKLIHALSHRHRGNFIRVSCPAIPHSLIETELFGYEKGAFTGALTSKRGRVEQAHHGTLVLDEVGSLDITTQAKLLQLLQDNTFTRVGGHEVCSIYTRVISIANNDLQSQVQAGTFRLDFLYRINAVTITLPSLRQRRQDIPALVDYFLHLHSSTFRNPVKRISKDVLQLMQAYDWPGNIRQLENLVRSYSLIGNEEIILSEVIAQPLRAEEIVEEIDISKPLSLKAITKNATKNLERQIIMKVLHAHSWNRQKTAKWLRISYRSLLYKLQEVGINDTHEATPIASSSFNGPVPAPVKKEAESRLSPILQTPSLT